MTPWPELLRISVLQLRIPPEQFWRLSLAEWRALTAQPAPETLPRAAFERLLEQHPDNQA